MIFKFFLIVILFPLSIFADNYPGYESLKSNDANLRHYPEKDDLYLKTIKFKLTQKGMPVKVIKEFNAGGKINEWRKVELFNGITGWLYHSLLSKKRTLLLKKDKNLFLFNSYKKNKFKTKVKAKILAPKIVELVKIKNNMAKIHISTNNNNNYKGWILIDDSIWGLKDEEISSDYN